ncbi:1159_t:CDS:2 [Acaulospora morrowiae]|uniref:1159_t:CDS:1 n=1 Tax=Acaulospora morrowiae TaxID=94023 RepID=A0A9N9DE04_9GLOM|nr:1159_t:CDS:2 [Acaulospora morrowiae]
MTIITLVSAVLKGYYQTIEDENGTTAFQSVFLAMLLIDETIILACFIKYGRLLVKLIDGSAQLYGVKEAVSSGGIDKLARYKMYITKLKLTNTVITVIMGWYEFICIFLLFGRGKIPATTKNSVIFMGINAIGTALVMLLALFNIAHGAIDITTSIRWSITSRIQSYEVECVNTIVEEIHHNYGSVQ